ncbi:MAG: O-antigen ligase family protein, partial [Bacteroidia bacterium]|nr:O-antigen ligase family protein [Bacteroidia bacterium]
AACAAICAVCLHVLALRTGLMALYGGALAAAALYARRRGAWRKFVLGVVGAFAALALSSAFVPSLNNRLKNTVEDLRAFAGGEDVTHRSLSKRLLVWGFAVQIWREHPLCGVGPGNVKAAILARYDRSRYRVESSERIADAHNQFLEAGAGLGALGFLTLLIIFAWPLARPLEATTLFFTTAIVLGAVGESFLERQTGVSFSILFWLFAHHANEKA